MAHNINQMVYAGETPWHDLGTKLPANGAWEDIRTAAGFYTAHARPLFVPGVTGPFPGYKAIVRGDSNLPLAVVSEGYEVIQFDELAHAGVVASAGVKAIWHTAGTLGETGARGWMLAELPKVVTVPGDPSEIRPFVLLTTAHDGSSAAILANVATRVVCQNTLGIALGERGGAKWTIRHTKNAAVYLQQAATAFRAMSHRMERFGELAAAMVARRLSEVDFAAVVDAAIPIPNDGEKHPGLEAQREELRGLRATFKGSAPKIVGTAWGDFQAVTQWADWHKPVRALPDGRGTSLRAGFGEAAARLESSTLGPAALGKARALEVIAARGGFDLGKVGALVD